MQIKIYVVLSGVLLLIDHEVGAQSFASRGYPGETLKAKIAFAESSEPIWFKVSSPLTLSEIIAKVCGNQPAEFLEYLNKQAAQLNDERSIYRPIAVASLVAVPFCHKIEHKPVVSVKDGDTLYKIAMDNVGVAGAKTLASIVELNGGPSNPSRREIELFSKSLKKGRMLTLPFRTTKRVFHMIPGGKGPRGIISNHPPFRFQLNAALKTVTSTNQIPKHLRPKRPRLEPVGFVPASSSVATGECPGSGGSPSSQPFDLKLVRARISVEKAFLDNICQSPSAAVIGIIDTGLKKIGNSFFHKRLFAANGGESGPLAKENRDDDGNGHKDDIWGSNFSARDGVIESFGGDGSKHGTRMSALALGGVGFIGSLTSTDKLFVKLRIVNFSSSLTAGLMDPSIFPEAVKYLAVDVRPRAAIINVSLSSSTNFRPIQNAIYNHPKVLFVVAAANDLEGGKDLSAAPAYPARLSGNHDFAANLITVASHTFKGGHAAHSNWGANVDLHAPGCGIESVHTDGTIVAETGSSVAAAIVSFAAGVVSALGREKMPSAIIKQRLIASSDMDSSLVPASWTTGRLNIVKAISLTHDVIEMKSGPRYTFSRLKDREQLRRFCAEDSRRKLLNNIRKVRPNLLANDGSGPIIEYWIQTPLRIAKVRCSQRNANQSIGVLINAGTEQAGPRLADVVDIVPASLTANPVRN